MKSKSTKYIRNKRRRANIPTNEQDKVVSIHVRDAVKFQSNTCIPPRLHDVHAVPDELAHVLVGGAHHHTKPGRASPPENTNKKTTRGNKKVTAHPIRRYNTHREYYNRGVRNTRGLNDKTPNRCSAAFARRGAFAWYRMPTVVDQPPMYPSRRRPRGIITLPDGRRNQQRGGPANEHPKSHLAIYPSPGERRSS